MDDPAPLCVICLVLHDRDQAEPAITMIGGDAICGDHVRLRADCASLPGALHVARTRPVKPLATRRHEARGSLLAETLTARERTILRYLTSDMSHDEIAAELFVTINTVKTHLRGIYRKLDVTERRDAVRRAQQLGLLGP